MQATNKLGLLFDDTSFSFRSFVGLVTIVGLVVLWNAPAVHTAPGMYPQDAHINVSVLGVTSNERLWYGVDGKPIPKDQFFGSMMNIVRASSGFRKVAVRLLITGKGPFYASTMGLIPTPGYGSERENTFEISPEGMQIEFVLTVPTAAKVLPPLKFEIQTGRGKLFNDVPLRGKNGLFDLPVTAMHDLGDDTQIIIKDPVQQGQVYSMAVMTTDGQMVKQDFGSVYRSGKNEEFSLQAPANKWAITRIYLYDSPAKTFTFSNIVVPPLPPKISNSGA